MKTQNPEDKATEKKIDPPVSKNTTPQPPSTPPKTSHSSFKQRQIQAKQRQFERMQSDPEMKQARQELKDEFLSNHPHYAQMTAEELTQEMQAHAESESKLRKQKLRSHMEAFSDGITAVIITIMLLEIPVPEGNSGYWHFLSAVGVFLVSFVVIANFWFNHHKTFAVTEEITDGILVQDFIFLGLLSLVPLLSKWIMIHPTWFSALNYGVVVFLIVIQQEWLNYSIIREHFRKMPKSFKFWRKIWSVRFFTTLLINAVITLVAVLFPLYGHWLFVIVPLFNFFFQLFNIKQQEFEFNASAYEVGVPRLK